MEKPLSLITQSFVNRERVRLPRTGCVRLTLKRPRFPPQRFTSQFLNILLRRKPRVRRRRYPCGEVRSRRKRGTKNPAKNSFRISQRGSCALRKKGARQLPPQCDSMFGLLFGRGLAGFPNCVIDLESCVKFKT